jgi:hypothetical protein
VARSARGSTHDDSERDEIEARRAGIAAEIKRAERAIERYYTAFEAGDIDAKRFDGRIAALQSPLDTLTDQRDELTHEPKDAQYQVVAYPPPCLKAEPRHHEIGVHERREVGLVPCPLVVGESVAPGEEALQLPVEARTLGGSEPSALGVFGDEVSRIDVAPVQDVGQQRVEDLLFAEVECELAAEH